MQYMKIVSVIIPTYKDRGGLRKAVISSLQQEGVSLEVIVVDDNQPESNERKATEQVMHEFGSEPRVKYIKHPCNKNGSAARNTGLRESKGGYIAFLDDDDMFLPGKLKKQVDYLDAHSDKDAVYTFFKCGDRIPSETIIEGNGTRQVLLMESNFQTSTLLFRRESLLKINGFDESFRRHQDYEMMLRFFASGSKLGCIPGIYVEMGKNLAENDLTGTRLEELKSYFLSKFSSFIQKENDITPGFANKVYSKHYASVFLSHIKHKFYIRALKIFFKGFFKAPIVFVGLLYKSFKIHMSV